MAAAAQRVRIQTRANNDRVLRHVTVACSSSLFRATTSWTCLAGLYAVTHSFSASYGDCVVPNGASAPLCNGHRPSKLSRLGSAGLMVSASSAADCPFTHLRL